MLQRHLTETFFAKTLYAIKDKRIILIICSLNLVPIRVVEHVHDPFEMGN